MKKMLLSVGMLVAACNAEAQTVAAGDTSLLLSAVRAARQRYRATAPEPRLVNGVAYGNNAPSYVAGRPFFLSSEPQPGTLDYDGQHFAGVALLYEQVQDQVLLYGTAQAEPVQLIRQQVRGFELAGHRFVHLPADAAGVVAEGFYDVVVAGPAQLLARRTKKLEASTGGYSMKGEYEEITRFFIQRPAGFYEVATLRQVLGALADKQTELQAHARRNHLRLAADSREASLAALVKEYNYLILK
ncbi:hypothetical protein [Hymenobacter nivis]|uniref:DUF4369 domain-containing protein n=1 Tax=Hymenobacter nivis TaxID=1850093 RepID=A0A502HF27_9BACT|nr:hypothetical protein [Hymenobacter nivis]TPG71820.1 hypothetical protein EAH73_00775 [Hymenobacter nivis]